VHIFTADGQNCLTLEHTASKPPPTGREFVDVAGIARQSGSPVGIHVVKNFIELALAMK
jgi:hypothetical protein